MIRHPVITEATREEIESAFGPEPEERRWYDAPFAPGELRELRRAAALDMLEPHEEEVSDA